jgi:hypothetical protein
MNILIKMQFYVLPVAPEFYLAWNNFRNIILALYLN